MAHICSIDNDNARLKKEDIQYKFSVEMTVLSADGKRKLLDKANFIPVNTTFRAAQRTRN